MDKLLIAVLCFSLLSGCGATGHSSMTPGSLCDRYTCDRGAVIRGDTAQRALALVFTGHEFAGGGEHIRSLFSRYGVKASFFFTGDFYRNPAFSNLIAGLRDDGHYLGAHSDRHLLYCPWDNRDSLLVNRREFLQDLKNNYREMTRFGIRKNDAPFFLPPYEWYNDRISEWTRQWGLHLVNFTPGTRSHADYTTPEMPNYIDSEAIYKSIVVHEKNAPHGLNGFFLLIHIGADSARTDMFYLRLEELILHLKEKGYQFKRIDELLN